MIEIRKKDLLYPELSYKIIGILFGVFNALGYGHKEKYYENALAVAFDASGLKYQKQVYAELHFRDVVVGKYFFDFLIENLIVLELKQGNYFSQKNIEQVSSYLQTRQLRLGIIAQFTSKGVRYKRIVNEF